MGTDGMRLISTVRELLDPGHGYFDRILPYFLAVVVLWILVILSCCWAKVRRRNRENRAKLIALLETRRGWTHEQTLDTIQIVRRAGWYSEVEAIHELLAQ